MPTLEERVAALEARFDAQTMSTTDVRAALTEVQADMNRRFEHVGQRFDELQDQMNRRFEQVHDHMNRRFDAADQKFTWLVGIVVTGFIAVISTVAGAFLGLLQMVR